MMKKGNLVSENFILNVLPQSIKTGLKIYEFQEKVGQVLNRFFLIRILPSPMLKPIIEIVFNQN